MDVYFCKHKTICRNKGHGNNFELPYALKKTNAILDVMNSDNECLAYAVIGAVYHESSENDEIIFEMFSLFLR